MPYSLPTRDRFESYSDDSPLTLSGEMSSQMLGNKLADVCRIRITRVYSSPALRCVTTCYRILRGELTGYYDLWVNETLEGRWFCFEDSKKCEKLAWKGTFFTSVSENFVNFPKNWAHCLGGGRLKERFSKRFDQFTWKIISAKWKKMKKTENCFQLWCLTVKYLKIISF